MIVSPMDSVSDDQNVIYLYKTVDHSNFNAYIAPDMTLITMNPIKKILVVDDDPDFLEIISDMLSSNGFEVRQATNGVEGLAKFEDETFDMIITDIMMPLMSGFDLVKKIREDYPQALPIIMASGAVFSSIPFSDDAKIKFLNKPFFTKDLIEAINSLAA